MDKSKENLNGSENTLSEPVQKKARKINFKMIALFSTSLLAIVGVSLSIALTTGNKKPTENTKSSLCYLPHESFGISDSYSLGKYSKFSVAADSEECSTVGREILERGGSAVDALIASALCNTLVNSHSMGIGGGHFMTIYKKDENTAYTIDARESAPSSATFDMFVKNTTLLDIGGLASGIPGEIKGYYEAYKIGGRLPWKELFQPAIKMCRDGFRVRAPLASALELRNNRFGRGSPLDLAFRNPQTNEIYKEDEIMKLPTLADTLEIIANEGSDKAFYNGVLTDIIVKEMNDNGGNVKKEDFNNYKATVIREAFGMQIDDNYTVYMPRPPSSAVMIPFVMKLIKGFNFIKPNMTLEDMARYHQRTAESFKHAFAKRARLGDENFVDISEVMDEFINEAKIEETRKKIFDAKTFPASYYGGFKNKFDRGTAHISVYGENGDAVAMTSSVNSYFGAKYMGETTGIIYNDVMDDFSTPGLINGFDIPPSEENFIAPGKRPMSSMAPIIIVDKNRNVRFVSGASGGSKIITAVAQVAMRVLWMNENLKNATDARRIHHQLYPEVLELEEEFPQAFENALEKVGHKTECFKFGGSIVQSIFVDDDKNIFAYSDPRKGGKSDGV